MFDDDEISDDDLEMGRRYDIECRGHFACEVCGKEVEAVFSVTDQGVSLDVCESCH